MLCPICSKEAHRYGKTKRGAQRWNCRECASTFIEHRETGPRVFTDRELTVTKAAEALRLLMEGTSVRSICRLLKVGQHTVLNLMRRVGEGCERLHRSFIRGVPVTAVQCDELHSIVHCRRRTCKRLGYTDPEVGDCYTWTGIDPITKLLVAYTVGQRDSATGGEFIRNLRYATSGRFQIDTDGLNYYRTMISAIFGKGTPHAQVIKTFSASALKEARYAPPEIVDVIIQRGGGDPDLVTASTSMVERHNLTFRMTLRRFTRLTNAHSKKMDYHRAVISLFVFAYNFVRSHMTLTEWKGTKTTPAMAAGLASRMWTMEELIQAAIPDGAMAVA